MRPDVPAPRGVGIPGILTRITVTTPLTPAEYLVAQLATIHAMRGTFDPLHHHSLGELHDDEQHDHESLGR